MIAQARPQQMFLTIGDGPSLPVIEYKIDGPEYDYARSENAVMPDPDWTFTDRNGHQHRWALTDRDDASKRDALPTLQRRTERVPCDGTCGNWDCDGWTRWAYNCRLCGALADPGYRPDYQARTTGIPIQRTPARYRFQVEGDIVPSGRYRYDDPPLRAVLTDTALTDASRVRRTGVAYPSGETIYGANRPPLTWVEMRFDDKPEDPAWKID